MFRNRPLYFRMKTKIRKTLLVLLILSVAAAGSGQYGKTSLYKKIEKQLAHRSIRPRDVTCISSSLRNDAALEKKCKNAVVVRFFDVRKSDIKRVVFQQKKWTISRNEFTAFIDYRYIFAKLLVHNSKKDQYHVAGAVFTQRNRFLGLLWGKVVCKSIGPVFEIKKEHINRVCD